MRRIFIAGNWKMHKTIGEAVDTVRKLSYEVKNITVRDIAVCPPFTALSAVYEVIKDTNIKLGAQNLFWEEKGAYTGEISPVMLKDAGCEYVIIGHSERREYFKETDEIVHKKILAALRNELKPIVCVGEKLEEREAGDTEKVVEKQVRGAFSGLNSNQMSKITIAYEPVWAIGTGKTATPEDANKVQKFIRNLISEMFDTALAENIRILYGGSVKPGNAKDLLAQEHIDGALVGGASLNPQDFSAIVKAGL